MLHLTSCLDTHAPCMRAFTRKSKSHISKYSDTRIHQFSCRRPYLALVRSTRVPWCVYTLRGGGLFESTSSYSSVCVYTQLCVHTVCTHTLCVHTLCVHTVCTQTHWYGTLPVPVIPAGGTKFSTVPVPVLVLE